jgi:hypothetical protein
MPKSRIGDMISGLPPDDQIGIFAQFTHPDQEYGWIRDRIKIFQQEGPGGAEPISLNVNGFRIDVPREVECDVARPFVENLRHTVETRFEKVNGEDVKRDVPRFHWVMVKENINLPILKDKLRKLQAGREVEGNGNDT